MNVRIDIQVEKWPISRLIPRITNPRTHTPQQVVLIAGVACVSQMHEQSFAFGLCLGAVWTILQVTGFVRFRRRGLWLLIGLPFAFFWPLLKVPVARRSDHHVPENSVTSPAAGDPGSF